MSSSSSSSSSSSTRSAVFVIDCEMTRHGKHCDLSILVAVGAAVFEPNVSIDLSKPLSDADLLQLVPKENRFQSFIHDAPAIDGFVKHGFNSMFWKEDEGKEFWSLPANKVLFESIFAQMRSGLDPSDCVDQFDTFVYNMLKKYDGNLIFVSDTSNFDFLFLEEARAIDDPNGHRLNFATKYGFLPPICTTSFYAGVTRQPVSSAVTWDDFNSNKALTEDGFLLPRTETAPKSHEPLDDAMQIGLKFVAVNEQLKQK